MRNNADFHQASVEESTVAFIFQARLQSGHEKNSLLNILDDVQTSVAIVKTISFFRPDSKYENRCLVLFLIFNYTVKFPLYEKHFCLEG